MMNYDGKNEKLLPTHTVISIDNEHSESDGIQQNEKEGFMDENSVICLELQRLILDKYQNELDAEPLPRFREVHLKPSNLTFETIFRNERDRYMRFVPLTKQKESTDGLKDDGILYQTEDSLCKKIAASITHLQEFKIYLNCSQFLPEELETRIIDNQIVVSGRHASKLDEHGLIAREFTSCYPIPDDVDKHSFSSSYNEFGILVIEARREKIPRVIRIQKECF